MQEISVMGINRASVFGRDFHRNYASVIKPELPEGFGIEFATMGHLGHFLCTLGERSASQDSPDISPDEARALAKDLQVDPFNGQLIAYFPDWTLS